MIPFHEPPAVVEQAPELDLPFDDLVPDLPDFLPGTPLDEPGIPEPAGDERDARAVPREPADLIREERSHLCDFLGALADFDRREGWRTLGHPSLLAYLTRELGLSAASAYQRKVAVGLVQRFPELLEPLRDGRLCLARVVDLARVMTPENGRDVLRRFSRTEPRPASRLA